MQNNVLILDFGSQYTQLIARRVRELNIYSEIKPYNKLPEDLSSYKAVILSGSPYSVRAADAPHPDLSEIKGKKPSKTNKNGKRDIDRTATDRRGELKSGHGG